MGIVRRIDNFGRVVIPKEIRRQLNIQEGDLLEIFTEGNVVGFVKYNVIHNVEVAINAAQYAITHNSDIPVDTSAAVIAKLNEAVNLLEQKV
jgi:AbrB family looped-hinge helix DNA binding protein